MSTIHDPAPPRRRWARLIGVPVAAVGLAGLAACGTAAGSTAAGSAASGSAGTGGQPDATMQAFTSCLAENGVTLPQRGDGGSPPSGAPSGGGSGSAPPSGAPTAGGSGGSGGSAAGGGPAAGGAAGGDAMSAPSGVDATTWAAAQQACSQYAPTPPTGTAAS